MLHYRHGYLPFYTNNNLAHACFSDKPSMNEIKRIKRLQFQSIKIISPDNLTFVLLFNICQVFGQRVSTRSILPWPLFCSLVTRRRHRLLPLTEIATFGPKGSVCQPGAKFEKASINPLPNISPPRSLRGPAFFAHASTRASACLKQLPTGRRTERTPCVEDVTKRTRKMWKLQRCIYLIGIVFVAATIGKTLGKYPQALQS